MITIPNNDLTPQENEELALICEALFIEVKDLRFISMIGDDTREERVEILRESTLCPTLYDMVSVFGEEDFIRFISGVLSKIASTDYTTEGYLKVFEGFIKEIL